MHLLGRDDVAVAALLDLLPAPERLGIRAGQAGRLEESGRVQPQIQLVALGIFRRHRHRRAVAVDVPGMLAVDDVRLPQCSSASACRPRQPRPYFHDAGFRPGLRSKVSLLVPGFPVDRARVVGQRVDARPVDVDGVLERLADGAAVAGARERDALEVRFADFPGRRRQQRRGIDVARRKLLRGCVDAEERDDSQQLPYFFISRFLVWSTPGWCVNPRTPLRPISTPELA